uniref:Uncharacterized protein n=1 Tax=Chromera velia CCMP2878 TaxID=1169474 RepID=A0A0G4F1U1_9ALVE|eukprot:Cvel_14640.t1-p1 / transcript=Cvel_14640.t1 / gene=Cvel_14640 / organism=Chromera_velia_CCMP2878 / gene_product=hypothetical protein / transcript_product=hypothetical protein / location=Cvel_scaffold1048:24437-24754(+) / protein_length=106 / sequence_SO=supercontig / SO=protein_coding / is_pseudo=false
MGCGASALAQDGGVVAGGVYENVKTSEEPAVRSVVGGSSAVFVRDAPRLQPHVRNVFTKALSVGGEGSYGDPWSDGSSLAAPWPEGTPFGHVVGPSNRPSGYWGGW